MTLWPRTYDSRTIHLLPFDGVRTFHGFFVQAPLEAVAEMTTAAQEPFVGITTDGTVAPGLYRSSDDAAAVRPVVDAARRFLDSIDQLDYRAYVQRPFDSWQRRSWFNAAPLFLPAGILLDDLRPEQREAALDLIAGCLSPSGFELLRNSMRVNEAIGGLFNIYTDTLREWAVWMTIFGDPSTERPWGWQLMGTHIDINCTVIGGNVLLEPLFLGAEICDIKAGPFEGLSLYGAERDAGLALGRTLHGKQRDKAVLYPSMSSADLPVELGGPVNGRHVGGAGRDNHVVPYEGVPAHDFDAEQRGLLRGLIEVYLSRLPDDQRARRRIEIEEHLDETHVAYVGDPERVPFYYRVHSPTLWIEFDHHPLLMLEGDLEPEQYHVHTIMRAPNGGDYGMALLRGPE